MIVATVDEVLERKSGVQSEQSFSIGSPREGVRLPVDESTVHDNMH